MFTGIVESLGIVQHVQKEGDNLRIRISCSFQNELSIDQSISHNGVCLTVCALLENAYEVIAISETLQKTSLKNLSPGNSVNLERCMPASGRFDGHIVQGHVDCTGACMKILPENGSWRIWFSMPAEFAELVVDKGSICVNGISLTVVESGIDFFSVAIIPYTWEHTNINFLKEGDLVNLEFDILGKYVKKMLKGQGAL